MRKKIIFLTELFDFYIKVCYNKYNKNARLKIWRCTTDIGKELYGV